MRTPSYATVSPGFSYMSLHQRYRKMHGCRLPCLLHTLVLVFCTRNVPIMLRTPFKDVEELHTLSTRLLEPQSAIVDKTTAYHKHIDDSAPAFVAANGITFRMPTLAALSEHLDKKQEVLTELMSSCRPLFNLSKRVYRLAPEPVLQCFRPSPKATPPISRGQCLYRCNLYAVGPTHPVYFAQRMFEM